MKNDIGKFFGLFVIILLLTLFWKPLVWLMAVFMVFMIVFGLRIIIKSSKIKDEINKNPDAYFNQYESHSRNNDVSSGDIIDVEYTEKEVGEDE